MAAGREFGQVEFSLPVDWRQRHVLTELEVFGDPREVGRGWHGGLRQQEKPRRKPGRVSV
jgi:hypothetical protein